MNLFVKIDEKGLVYNLEDQVITDLDVVQEFLDSLTIDSHHTFRASLHDQSVVVEPFSFPLIATDVHGVQGTYLQLDCENEYTTQADLNKIFLDYKDRFIMYSDKGIPILFNRQAQEQLFDMAESFSDDAIVIEGQEYSTPPWIDTNATLSDPHLWSERYTQNDTGWDMGGPSPSLVWAVEKLKLPKMRVAVLGCGVGHDAQLFASKGHKVTGIDFSPEAIHKAETLYPSNANLQWVCRDVFEISEEFKASFDLVVEHTCFCAIDPLRRGELVRVWKSILSPEGQVLGVFFVMPKTYGPPYGSTEEEIHDLMAKDFRKNLWVRSKVSHPGRLGRELIVLARVNRV